MPSIISSVNELRSSILPVFVDLFRSLLAVFYAILALGQNIVSAVLKIGRALLNAAVGIAGGVAEVIWVNLFVIALFAGCYYVYTQKMQKGPKRSKKKS